ncbi:MAG: histidine phosphatase family protein [Marinospirillum sp.]|uniref:histidine phosphatase family protein n=1 Tax=Marinospirillum sp. TaxID=2183934 RepID=UPI0019E99E26|nr:histidine phosphatase family protein [Marinospirillum sp.]MBE0508045.1 histidine phosphatase family protein [Marinospirillum sp.]
MRSVNAELTVFDLIRHGEPQGGRKFRGSTDHPLSELGWQQMKEAVAELAPWDAIVTSPLLRCREFAEWLGDRHHLQVTVDEDLVELYLGGWEGLTHAEARAKYPPQGDEPDSVTAFWTAPLDCPPPEGETLTAFDQRIAAAWQRMNERFAGQHVLVVAHLFTCNFLIRQVLQQPLARALSFDIPYAGLTRIRREIGPDGEVSQLEWVGMNLLPQRAPQGLAEGR